MYQDLYDNINFEANYWLPGVDTLSLQNDGSIKFMAHGLVFT